MQLVLWSRQSAGVLAAVACLSFMPFVLNQYLLNIFVMIFFWIMLTSGLNLVGAMGYISICHAAFYGIGAYVAAILTLRTAMPFWLNLAAGAFGAGLMGLLIGFPAFRVRGHYFAIATLAFGLILSLVFHNWQQMTNGDRGLTGIFSPVMSPAGYYYLVLAAVLVVVLVMHLVLRSRLGRQLMAIREDEDLAQQMGIHTMRCKLIAFALGAVFAGLSGGLMAHYINFVHPDFFTFGYSFNVIMGMLLGGVGTTLGAVLGGVIAVALPEVLRFAFGLRYIAMGLVLVLVIILMPRGVVGTIASQLAARKRMR